MSINERAIRFSAISGPGLSRIINVLNERNSLFSSVQEDAQYFSDGRPASN